jgi:hypothetical protein
MKKILLAIPYFFWWILYVILTLDKRTEYQMAVSEGMDCVGSEDDSMFIKGTTTIYYFDPSKPPTRRYVTWKEFWESRGY